MKTERIIEFYSPIATYLISVVKWVLVLNLVIGWIVFWGNLIRLHYSMGDIVSAGLTAGVFFGPLVAGSFWWLLKNVRKRNGISTS